MSELLKFNYGLEENLPSSPTGNEMYLTTDTHSLWTSVGGGDIVRLTSNLTYDLLWENANPNSNFSGNISINIDENVLNDYTFLNFVAKYSTTQCVPICLWIENKNFQHGKLGNSMSLIPSYIMPFVSLSATSPIQIYGRMLQFGYRDGALQIKDMMELYRNILLLKVYLRHVFTDKKLDFLKNFCYNIYVR